MHKGAHKKPVQRKNCHQFDAVNVIVCIIVLCCQYLYKIRLMITISFEMQDVWKVFNCLLYPVCVLQSLLSNASSHIHDETIKLQETPLSSLSSLSVCVVTHRVCNYSCRSGICILKCLNKKWLNRSLCFYVFTYLCLFEKLDFIGVLAFRNWQWNGLLQNKY